MDVFKILNYSYYNSTCNVKTTSYDKVQHNRSPDKFIRGVGSV